MCIVSIVSEHAAQPIDAFRAAVALHSTDAAIAFLANTQPAEAMLIADITTHLLLTICLLLALPAHAQLPLLISATDAEDSTSRQSETADPSSSAIPERKVSASLISSSRAASSTAGTSKAVNSDKDTSKIKLTLARMHYEQAMCEDVSKVMNGATLNVSWTSKGRLSNSLYVRSALDKYTSWLPFPTFPPFSGQKEGDGDDEDPAATYRLASGEYAACRVDQLRDPCRRLSNILSMPIRKA